MIGRRGCRAVLAGVLSLGLVACTEEAKPTKAVLLVFDISASAPGEMRERYGEWAKEVIRKRHPAPVLGPGDVLVLARVTEASLSEPDLPRLELTAFDPGRENEMVALARSARELAPAEGMIDAFLAEDRWSMKSHILDALSLASQVLESLGRDRKILVVFSDMIEESDRYDFFGQPLDRARIEEILALEQERGRMPDLEGVEVFVAGAGAGPYAQRLSTEKLAAIRAFWLQYFAETGADLRAERYLPTFMGIEP